MWWEVVGGDATKPAGRCGGPPPRSPLEPDTDRSPLLNLFLASRVAANLDHLWSLWWTHEDRLVVDGEAGGGGGKQNSSSRRLNFVPSTGGAPGWWRTRYSSCG